MKSEPDVFSFDDLVRAPDSTTLWDGVRNYQARNTLREEMRVGDLVLYYHSNARPPGVAGVARVVREGYPDPTQFDPADDHFDPKAREEDPTWYVVDLQAVAALPTFVPIDVLKGEPRLAEMPAVQRGQRLSVQPVTPAEFRIVLGLGGLSPKALA